MRRLVVLGIVALSFAVPRTASAGSITFVPDVTPGIGAAINSDGFFATPDSMNLSLFGAFAYAYDGHIEAFGAGYSDAGLTVGFGGQFALGDIQSVSVNGPGSPLSINLWLDTSGDNAFFAFDPS